MTHRTLSAALLLALAASACAPRATRGGRDAPLSRDSAAVLERALRMARPAYETQEEALRAGAYRAAAAPPTSPEPVVPEAPGEAPTAPAAEARVALLGREGAGYVIQIAAHRDRPSAERAAREAERAFPGLEVVIEAGGGYFRVALAGWPTAAEAEARLAGVRASHPDAWIRPRALP